MLTDGELAELRLALEECQRRHVATTNETLSRRSNRGADALRFFGAAYGEDRHEQIEVAEFV
jgi:hypothetical protein